MPLKIGDSMSVTKIITQDDVNDFIKLSGDNNPIHYDEEYAKKSVFGRKVAHGILVTSYISAAIAQFTGAIYMGQELSFKRPVFIGDTVIARVEVVEIIKEDKGIYRLKTTVINQNHEIVIDGEATIKYSEGV